MVQQSSFQKVWKIALSWTWNSKAQLTLLWTDLFNIHFCTLITVCKLKRAWWESSLAASATAYHAGKITISCFFLAILPSYDYIFESFELLTKFAIRISNSHEFFTTRSTLVFFHFFVKFNITTKMKTWFDIKSPLKELNFFSENYLMKTNFFSMLIYRFYSSKYSRMSSLKS